MVARSTHRWWALALLSAFQFMVVLDIAIVNVALPSIQADLGFSQENLQWVISAYALGGALGIAIISSVAVAHTSSAVSAGDAAPAALTTGFHAAFWVGAAVAVVGVVASLVLVRKQELAATPAVAAEPDALPLAA